MQECSKCHLSGDTVSFYPNSNKNAWCKACIKAFRKRRVRKAIEEVEHIARVQVAIRTLLKGFQANKEQFLYLLETNNSYKIGFSANIDRRVATFNTAQPTPCNIIAVAPGGRQQEQELHKRLDRYRITGEWFAKNDTVFKRFSNLPGSMVFLPGYMTEEGVTPPCDIGDSSPDQLSSAATNSCVIG